MTSSDSLFPRPTTFCVKHLPLWFLLNIFPLTLNLRTLVTYLHALREKNKLIYLIPLMNLDTSTTPYTSIRSPLTPQSSFAHSCLIPLKLALPQFWTLTCGSALSLSMTMLKLIELWSLLPNCLPTDTLVTFPAQFPNRPSFTLLLIGPCTCCLRKLSRTHLAHITLSKSLERLQSQSILWKLKSPTMILLLFLQQSKIPRHACSSHFCCLFVIPTKWSSPLYFSAPPIYAKHHWIPGWNKQKTYAVGLFVLHGTVGDEWCALRTVGNYSAA